MTKDQELLYQILGEVKDLATKVEVNTVYQKGHGQRLDKLEPKVDDLITEKNVSAGKRTVWALVFGAIGSAIFGAIKYFSTNH